LFRAAYPGCSDEGATTQLRILELPLECTAYLIAGLSTNFPLTITCF
jgi:hypothetical protein